MNSIDPQGEIRRAWRFKDRLKYSIWSSLNDSQHNNRAAAHLRANPPTQVVFFSDDFIHCCSLYLFKLNQTMTEQANKSDGSDGGEVCNDESKLSDRLIEAPQLYDARNAETNWYHFKMNKSQLDTSEVKCWGRTKCLGAKFFHWYFLYISNSFAIQYDG